MNNIWSRINNKFKDVEFIYIDAWETPDENEEGKVIAKINMINGNIIYIDDRAKKDDLAQKHIKEGLLTIFPRTKVL